MSGDSAEAWLEICYDVAIAKHQTAAIYVTGLVRHGHDRSAAATLSKLVRERLENAPSAVDTLISFGRG